MTDKEKLKFHLIDGKGNPCGVFDYEIVEFIKDNNNIFVMGGTPYFYEKGLYRIDKTGARLKTAIKSCILPKFIKSTTITRIYQLFLQDYELEKNYNDINKYPEYWIPFKNFMFDVKNNHIVQHDPKYFCINQIPWDLPMDLSDELKKDEGKETENFLKNAMSAEDRKTLLQYLGLCMTRLNFQKFIILKGSRGTGKSTVIHMFEQVLGTGNYSNIALQKLEEKFYSIQLMGKMLNLCADINSTPLKTVNSIKLITGGDSISDSFKGKDIVTFEPYARLMFSCNSVPLSLDEKSNALFERIILIEMDNRPDEPDRGLNRKIESEIPYIIKMAIRGVQEALKNNELYESQKSKNLVNELYMDSDTVQAFIMSQLDRDVNGKIRSSQLTEMYKDYCHKAEREPLSRNNFYRNLREKGYGKKTIKGYDFITGLTERTQFMNVDEHDIPFN